MDLASSSACLSFGTVLMSGFGAPPLTAKPMVERTRSRGCRPQPTFLDEAVRRRTGEDDDVELLAARQPRRDGVGRVAHRGAKRRDDLVPAFSLEQRHELFVGFGESA